ncbi:MAG: hypothetical protein HW380_3805 [Magnetococcales bacterium]|nr:hypothetical protein [Magnetococcales bacterium]
MRSWFMYRKNKVCQDLNRNQIGILGFSNVIPAKAGIQGSKSPVNARVQSHRSTPWIPAFAGMTGVALPEGHHVRNDVVLHIPNPHRGAIGKELLIRLLRQGKISRQEWEQP